MKIEPFQIIDIDSRDQAIVGIPAIPVKSNIPEIPVSSKLKIMPDNIMDILGYNRP